MSRNLIIFAKEPVAGKVKTRLARHIGAPAATRVYEAMVAELAHTLLEFTDGVQHWWVDGDAEKIAALQPPDSSRTDSSTGAISGALSGTSAYTQQTQGDLGERLRRAFADTFAGFDGPVAAIGTDCPTLDAKLLNRLFSAVEAGADAAVIPTSDGGYAALALASRFDGAFEQVRWSSEHTLADTLARLTEVGLAVETLEGVSDVDEYADLKALCRHIRTAPATSFTHLRPALEGLGLLHETAIPDDLCRPVALAPAPATGHTPITTTTPARMVSLVPSVTECLFDLGIGDAVVGRTDYCISPPAEVAKLPSVGGPKSLDVEAIIALAPDLVWADAEENSREEVEELIEAGLRVFAALPRTLGDVASFLRRAALLCATDTAHERAAFEAQRLEKLSERSSTDKRGKTSAVALIWRAPYMSVAPGTLPGALMEAAGFANLVPAGPRSYPELREDEIRSLAPEVLLLPSEPYLFTKEEADELEHIFPSSAALLFPGEWLCWYGLRTFEQVEKMRNMKNM